MLFNIKVINFKNNISKLLIQTSTSLHSGTVLSFNKSLNKLNPERFYKIFSYGKFVYFWNYFSYIKTNFPTLEDSFLSNAYKNELFRNEKLLNDISTLEKIKLSDLQLSILDKIPIYYYADEKIICEKNFKYTDTKLSKIENLKKSFLEYQIKLVSKILSFTDFSDSLNIKVLKNFLQINKKKLKTLEKQNIYYVFSKQINPPAPIFRSFSSLSKGDFNLLRRNKDFLYNSLIESTIYKIYVRENYSFVNLTNELKLLLVKPQNVIQSYLAELKLLLINDNKTQLNISNFIKDNFLVYKLPKYERILHKRKDSVFFFLNKEDIKNVPFFNLSLKGKKLSFLYLRPSLFSLYQTNLGDLYRENNRDICPFNFVFVPSSEVNLINYSNYNVFDSITLYMLDMTNFLENLDIYSPKTNKPISFYPIKVGKGNLKLLNIFSSSKAEILKIFHELNKSLFYIEETPTIKEVSLSDLFSVLNKFDNKKDKFTLIHDLKQIRTIKNNVFLKKK